MVPAAAGMVAERFRVRQFSIPVILSVVSFAIYAAAILIVHYTKKEVFAVERSSIAAAASKVYYRAPLGTVYSGVLERFLAFDKPIDTLLADASRQEIPPGALLKTTSDGNGIGYMVVTSVGLRLFGAHSASIVALMLMLMGASTLAYLWRFRDGRAVVAILYFTALTVMLCTSLVWADHTSRQMPIGGIRYFSLVAILPAFHLLLECLDARPLRWRGGGRSLLLPVVAQVPIMVLAILVRNSSLPLIGAVGAGAALIAWSRRREAGAAWATLRKAAQMALIGAVFIGILLVSVSSGYVKDGRFTETVWHRIFVSFGISTEFPFEGLREIYDCSRYIPEGLVSGPEDRNGHCILWAYAMKHNIPPEVVVTLTYGRTYDVALREAFFNIAWLYPAETLRTFLYFKTSYIPWSIKESMRLHLAGLPPALGLLLLAALANLLAFAFLRQTRLQADGYRAITGFTGLLALSSIPPLMAVWAMPHTSGDLTFYCFFGLGFALVFAIGKARERLWSR